MMKKKGWEGSRMSSRTRSFFLNALSLTLTAFAMRGVGMAFNIYVSAKAGSEVMGLYSLIGSVYGFAVTLAAAGINLGTTRLVSDALGLRDQALAKRSVKRALLVCSISGGSASLLLFFGAPFFGTYLLGDSRTVTSLRIMALTLLPIAICSCLSGYFTAVRRVKLNAVFQLPTQLIKIVATVFFLWHMSAMGTEETCIALVLGTAVSEFASLFLTYLLYRHDLKKLTVGCAMGIAPSYSITKKLLGITLPVTFSACARSALSMIQHMLIPRGLRASGQTQKEALSSYGALHGMAMPLLLFPSAVVYSFSSLLIPEVSECCIRREFNRLSRISYRALTLSLLFSIGVSGIMVFYSKELGMFFYHNEETALYIRVMAPLIPVMYIDSTVDAILKGSGHQVYSMNVNIADALTACLLALTLIPRLGIWGYVISIYATELLNTTLSLYKMLSVSKMHPRIGKQVLLPVFCVVGATNLSRLFLFLIPEGNSGVFLLIGILFTVCLYLLLLLMTGCIEKKKKSAERLLIPAFTRTNKQPTG